MKKLICLLLTTAMVVIATACAHEHEYAEATCDKPKTCTICGATEGKALGHKFEDATCDKPKTCTVCGATEGEALGHQFEEATCDKPKTCKLCGLTEGEALGHSTEFGNCDRCGTFVDKDGVISKLNSKFNDMDSYFKRSVDCVNSAGGTTDLDTMYSYYCLDASYKQDIRSCAGEIAGICSGYSLLSGVESAARAVSEYYITEPSDSSPDSLISYIDDATEFNDLVIALEEANQSVLEPLIGSR